MTYEQKSAIVISQLRADRDRLLDAFDKMRAEIDQIADEEQKYDKKWAKGLRYAVKIIDKYKKESEEQG